MRYSEDTLKSWMQPLSETEEKRVENTANMIKSAIAANDTLKRMNIEVFAQGSYANNTNVKAESDIDICVMSKETFHTKYPDGKRREDYGFLPSDMTYERYRELVKNAMQDKFGYSYVNDGDKSIKIKENTYRVQADVVPCLQLRNYYYGNSINPDKYVEGTWFISKSGKEISNYPKVHKSNGIDKNNKTNYSYKKIVRILKHIKNNMVEDGITNGSIISSFLVECLVYNVPNNEFTSISNLNETIKRIIRYIYGEINNGNASKWGEVSEILYLFHNGRKWTIEDVKKWLEDTWLYLGYGN